MKKNIFVFCLLISITGLGQTHKGVVNFPSPNAASLGLFGSIPINHFTGMPNISIPLYKITDGAIEIPIKLNYHLGAVKVNAHPGWTGLGWSLSTGGAITRRVFGRPDEIKEENTGFSAINNGFYFHRAYNDAGEWIHALDSPDWSESSKIKEYAHAITFGNDTQPDEFHFNFLGYSGTFYLNEKLEWVVKSDQNVKIIFDENNGGFVSQDELRNSMNGDKNPLKHHTVHYLSDYYFNEFTILTDDGTKYKFGGINATEYSVDYRSLNIDFDTSSTYLIPTSWNLIEIKTSDGKTITYEYESIYKDDEGNDKEELICSLTKSYSYFKLVKEPNGSLDPECSKSGNLLGVGRRANGQLLFPVYLKRIISNSAIVEFERSNTTELRYDDYNMGGLDIDETNVVHFEHTDELQWKKLDLIRIKKTNGDEVKSFSLNYTNDTETRLKLLSLDENNTFNDNKITHTFRYNELKLPEYFSNSLDHWGYYNGYSGDLFESGAGLNVLSQEYQEYIDRFLSEYHSTREPSTLSDFYKAETLETIIYPSGGYTKFEYEQNDFRKIVSPERDGVIELSSNTLSGGLRISKILSYDTATSNPEIKEYFYLKSYSGQNISNLNSSGIQNSYSKYFWENYTYQDLSGATFVMDRFGSNNLFPDPFNGQGSPVGYSEVVEKTNGAGYKIYTFTNYENHLDEQAITHTDLQKSIYTPISSKSLERGKIKSIITYGEDTKKKYEEVYDYKRSSEKFLRALDLEYLNICYRANAAAQSWSGTAYKKYIYNYNLVKKESKTYDENETNEVVNIQEYKYNDEKLITEIKTKDSKSREIITTYEYPMDYPSDVGMTRELLNEMINAYILNPKIRVKKSINSKLISTQVTTYSKAYTGDITDVRYYPRLIRTSKGDNSLEDRIIYEFYDSFGNPKQIRKIGGSSVAYIWGYNGQYPIAKIDFAQYALIQNALGISHSEELNETHLTAINALRYSKPDWQITTYEYKPLIGVKNITNPNGVTTHYEYDEFNRLKYIKDKDKNLLASYQYHYANH